MEIYGPEASGKTTLALHVIAEAQKQGGYYMFLNSLAMFFTEPFCIIKGTSVLKNVLCVQEHVSL